MYNKHYTHQDLTRAVTDTTMSSIQRYSILDYFGYTTYEIKQVYQNLTNADNQEQQIKKQVESIIKDVIKDIKDF